jgi:hypothetical protein
MEDYVTIEECQSMGFDDGEEEAWSRLDDGIETDSIFANEHDWLRGILAIVGRSGFCAILGEPSAENEQEWTAAMQLKVDAYCASAQEGAEHVLKVLHGNRAAGS